MGQPVVQFEVMGEDADKLQSFYSDLFDWKITSHGNYGIVERHVNGDGVGIAGGVGSRRMSRGTSPSTSRFPTSKPLW